MEWLNRLRQAARTLKRDIGALWLAARDPRLPWHIKAFAAAIVAYALSPIDLIPDFIPVLGYLDDLIIVPFGIFLLVRMIPAPLMAEFRTEAEIAGRRPRSVVGLVAIVVIWLALLVAIAWAVFRR